MQSAKQRAVHLLLIVPSTANQLITSRLLVIAIWCAWISCSCLPSEESQTITVPSSKMDTWNGSCRRHIWFGKRSGIACQTSPHETRQGSKRLIKGSPLHLLSGMGTCMLAPVTTTRHFGFWTQTRTYLQILQSLALVAFMGSWSSMESIRRGGSNCQTMILFGTRPSAWLLNLSLQAGDPRLTQPSQLAAKSHCMCRPCFGLQASLPSTTTCSSIDTLRSFASQQQIPLNVLQDTTMVDGRDVIALRLA